MTTLAQYERARAALAEATSINEVLPILDEVEHVKLYARQIADQDLLVEAEAFQMKAERRLGIIIKAAKESGHFREGRPKKNGAGGEPFPSVTLADVGVDKKLSARAQKIGGIAEQAFEAMVAARREQIRSGKATPINGARAIMGSRQEPDDSLDYFPTPPWATRALMEVVMPAHGIELRGAVREPACGEGHIAEVLREYCTHVYPSDIFDYGYGDEVVDYLKTDLNFGSDWVVTNPPFGDAALDFVDLALMQARIGVAMFFRSQWAVEGIERYERLFCRRPPTICAFFVERVNLCKGRWDPDGSTATAYCWLVWHHGGRPLPTFWIPPGQREALTRPDDRELFTAHPVIKRSNLADDGSPTDLETGEIKSEAAE